MYHKLKKINSDTSETFFVVIKPLLLNEVLTFETRSIDNNHRIRI